MLDMVIWVIKADLVHFWIRVVYCRIIRACVSGCIFFLIILVLIHVFNCSKGVVLWVTLRVFKIVL